MRLPPGLSPAERRVAQAVPIPLLEPGSPPLAVLVDFDGTIALTDIADTLVLRYAPEGFDEDGRRYLEGWVGTRTLASEQVARLPADRAALFAAAGAQPLDPTFAAFALRAATLGVPVEIVSDGFGFYIEPALARLGLADIPVATAEMSFAGGRPSIAFPNGHPDCHVCGTCKRLRVRAHQAAGRAVAFVGDGASDRYAAAYADVVFAKRYLAEACRAEGWRFASWHDFGDVGGWLEATVEAWRAGSAALPAPGPGHLVCGPELWGPGRIAPLQDDAGD